MMTPPANISAIIARPGITYGVEDGRFWVEDDGDTLTPDDMATLGAHRETLVLWASAAGHRPQGIRTGAPGESSPASTPSSAPSPATEPPDEHGDAWEPPPTADDGGAETWEMTARGTTKPRTPPPLSDYSRLFEVGPGLWWDRHTWQPDATAMIEPSRLAAELSGLEDLPPRPFTKPTYGLTRARRVIELPDTRKQKERESDPVCKVTRERWAGWYSVS